MLQEADHIKRIVLTFQHIQCLHLMCSEAAWVLLSSGTQVQSQIILDPDYLLSFRFLWIWLRYDTSRNCDMFLLEFNRKRVKNYREIPLLWAYFVMVQSGLTKVLLIRLLTKTITSQPHWQRSLRNTAEKAGIIIDKL